MENQAVALNSGGNSFCATPESKGKPLIYKPHLKLLNTAKTNTTLCPTVYISKKTMIISYSIEKYRFFVWRETRWQFRLFKVMKELCRLLSTFSTFD
jgi:hypothetical protein